MLTDFSRVASACMMVPQLREKWLPPRRLSRLLGSIATALVVMMLPISSGRADGPAENEHVDLRQRTEWLIDGLDAETRSQRAQAEKALLELGPPILALLPPPDSLPNATLREAVRRIRVRLERQKAVDSIEPSRVTIENDLSLADLFSAIQEQTGNPIDVSKLPRDRLRETISVRYRRQTFWSVVDDVADRAELRYEFGNGELAFAALEENAEPREAAASRGGAFRVALDSVEVRPLLGDDARQLLRVRIGVAAEPRLRPLFVKFAVADIVAQNGDGQHLEPYNPAAKYELPLGEEGRRVKMQAEFLIPSERRLTRVDLWGRLMLTTAAGQEHIEFADVARAQGTARRRGGVTVRLQRAAIEPNSAGGQSARIRVAVAYDTGGPAFESHRTWIFHNRAFVEDAEGRKIEPDDFRTGLQADGGVAVEYNFGQLNRGGHAYRFVYVAPTLIIGVPLEFTFTNVPVSQTTQQGTQR